MDRETPFGDRLQPQIPSGGSIFLNREFGNIRGGPKSGFFGVPGIKDLPLDFSELDDLEAQDAETQELIEKAMQEEKRGALETLKAFGQDVTGRTILANILAGAGNIRGGPTVGITVGGIAGLMKGGDLFKPTPSQDEEALNKL